MFSDSKPYVLPLGDGLMLKSVSTLDDAQRVADFQSSVHGPAVGPVAYNLILHHPYTRPEHWLFVEEEANKRVVSGLCLIPWRWRYEDVELRVGEMGICATAEDYRNRGLVRALMKRHKELLREGEYHLSQIQGIPYFYRQFSYEYAMPLEGGWHVELHELTNLPADGYTFRLANIDDLPVLMRLYDETMRDLAISACRDEAEWRYLFEHTDNSEMEMENWVVVDAEGRIAGYWRVQKYGFGTGLNINECSEMDHAAAAAVLGYLKTQAEERAKPYIRLIMHDQSNLIKLAQTRGAHSEGRYAWQIHIPDVPRLLLRIAPVLERRLANSAFAELTQTVILNLYKTTFRLQFEGGKLRAVDAMGFSDEGEIRIPPLLFAPLVLGWRTWRGLRANYPDVRVEGMAQALMDVLFPKMDAFIYTIY